MANAVFPGAIKTWTDKQNGTDNIMAEHINEAYAEIIAVETEIINNTNPDINDLQAIAAEHDGKISTAETDIDNLQLTATQLSVHTAQTDADLASLRATQAQQSSDTRLDLTGTGKVTAIPRNAAIMGVGGVVKGMTLTNLIKNGDFNNGITSWTGGFATLSAASNVLSITAQTGTTTIRASQDILPYISGKKIYVQAKMRCVDANVTKLGIWLGATGMYNSIFEILSPVVNQWYIVSAVLTLGTGGSGTVALWTTFSVGSQTTVKVGEVKEVIAIDMTTLGLDAKTATEMGYYCPSYFSGMQSTIAMRIKSLDSAGVVKSACYIEPCILRRNASGIYDEIDIQTGRLTTRLDNNGNALVTPIYKNNVISGVLNSFSKGTIICEPVIADAGIYNKGISILRTAYPISSFETISKVNADSTLTPIDVSTAVIASGGLSFTHPSLTNGDIVAFTYFTASAGLIGENVFNYVNANGLVLGLDGKYYRVYHTVAADGTIGHAKTEVV